MGAWVARGWLGSVAEAIEVRVTTAEVDLVAGLLWGAEVSAVVEEEHGDGSVVLRADVPPSGIGAVARVLGDRWPVEAVVVDDGFDGWRAHARVVRAGRFVVRPPWVPRGEIAPGEVVVEIDPGRSFGHGAHPTTRLCLAVLSDILLGPSDGDSTANRPRSDGESTSNRRPTWDGGPTVLDVGCGSGVLAIAAVVGGAPSAAGIDVDPEAVAATAANAARNGVADRIVVADLAVTRERRFDVVLANIGAAALRSLAPDLVAAVATGGTLVLSGLLDPPPDDLVAAFVPLELVEDRRRDGWTALVLRKP